MRNKIKVWDRDSVMDRSSGINQVRKRIVNFWPFSFTTRIVKYPAILINTGIFPVLCLICFGTILNIIILIIICEIVYLIFIFKFLFTKLILSGEEPAFPYLDAETLLCY